MKFSILVAAFASIAILTGCSANPGPVAGVIAAAPMSPDPSGPSDPTGPPVKTTLPLPTTTVRPIPTLPGGAVDNSKLLNDPAVVLRTIAMAEWKTMSAEDQATFCVGFRADREFWMKRVADSFNVVLKDKIDSSNPTLIIWFTEECAK